MVEYDKLSVVVVGHTRRERLQYTLDRWVETLPDYRAIYVIANHPTTLDGVDFPPRTIPVPTGRVPEHEGNLTESWNLGMQWTFRDPSAQWCLCSQDDVRIEPGWPEIVSRRDADLYLAPGGDNVFLFNRRIFREVGWFDERFRGIGFHEWDWEARVLLAVGRDRVVMEDQHGWHFNPLGLGGYWKQWSQETCNSFGYAARADSGQVFAEKWGRGPGSFIDWFHAQDFHGPLRKEIEWYPWFPRQ